MTEAPKLVCKILRYVDRAKVPREDTAMLKEIGEAFPSVDFLDLKGHFNFATRNRLIATKLVEERHPDVTKTMIIVNRHVTGVTAKGRSYISEFRKRNILLVLKWCASPIATTVIAGLLLAWLLGFFSG